MAASLPADFLTRLPLAPDGYPQNLDLARELILFVELQAGDYRAASFLDDRILMPATRGGWVPVRSAIDASRQLARAVPLHFIFHTGHVGSTLVSRLLDETSRVLSLREPLPLRLLAEAHQEIGRPWSLTAPERFAEILELFLHLWSRGYSTTRAVVIKATSSAGSLASLVLEKRPAARAIYLNVRAETYLATLLSGANSPLDLRGHGPGRMKRLHARLGGELRPLHALSMGELAAMSWLVESLSERDAVSRCGERVLTIDFDRFLDDVVVAMERITRHLGIEVEASYLANIARSAVMTSYSKAPQMTYTPAHRRQQLSDAGRTHAAEIRRGMEWLAQMGGKEPAIAQLLV